MGEAGMQQTTDKIPHAQTRNPKCNFSSEQDATSPTNGIESVVVINHHHYHKRISCNIN